MINFVIVGVGGQGTLLASRILGTLATEQNLDVKVSEVHGMSQRGGSVITFVRIGAEGEAIYSPLVEQKEADFVLAFEALEALRALPYLKEGGTLIANTQKILPMPVITGNAVYPEDTVQRIEAVPGSICVDALSLAEKCGTARAVNTVLLGILSEKMRFTEAQWHEALAACVPVRHLQANMAAFEIGKEAAKS